MKKIIYTSILGTLLWSCSTSPKPQSITPTPLTKQSFITPKEIAPWFLSLSKNNTESWSRNDSIRFAEMQFENLVLSKIIDSASVRNSNLYPIFQEISKREIADSWAYWRYNRLMGMTPDSLIDLMQSKGFSRDSLNQNFLRMGARWAESLVADSSHLYSYYLQNREKWKKPRQYELATILYPLTQKDSVLELLKSESFENVAKRFSKDEESAPNGGYLGWYYQGVDPGVLYPSGKWLYDSLYTMKNNAGQVYYRPNINTFGLIIKVLRFRDEELPPYDSIKDYNRSQFLAEFRRNLNNTSIEALIQQNGLQKPKLPYPSPMEFYTKNINQFMSPPLWKLLAVEMKDSAVLATKIAQVKNKVDFQKLLKDNTNPYLKTSQGVLWYKEGTVLPYDLGEQKGLLAQLPKLSLGKVEGIYARDDKKGFVAFYLDTTIPKQLKPLDRVAKIVEQKMEQSNLPLPDSTPLLLQGDQVVLWERDYQIALQSIPYQQRRQFLRKHFIDQSQKNLALVNDAQDHHFAHSPIWSAKENLLWKAFLAQIVKDSVLETLNVDSTKLSGILAKKPNLFTNLPLPPQKAAALYLNIPQGKWIQWTGSYLDSLGKNPYKYTQADMDSAFKFHATDKEFSLAKNQLIFNLKTQHPSTLPPQYTSFALMSQMDSLVKYYKKGQDTLANDDLINLYRRHLPLGIQSTQIDSLYYQFAKLLSDKNKQLEAYEPLEYIEYNFPKSPIHDRALFLKGYIEMEFQKKENQAVRTFKRLIQLHPQSKLADDADFLVRDIQSDHQLTKDLIKKLETK